MKSFFKKIPFIIGEGGGIPGIPSNTIESFQKAFELGADAVSFSVSCTKDFFPVILSTPMQDEMKMRGEKISNLSWQQLSEIKISSAGGNSSPLMTLNEALTLFKGNQFLISLLDKDIRSADAVIACIRENQALENVLLGSPNGKIIDRFRCELPGCATSFSIMSIIGIYFLLRSGLIAFKGSLNGDALVTAENLGTSYIANDSMVNAMHQRGISVFVRTADTDRTITRALESGADGIITSDVPRMLRISETFKR